MTASPPEINKHPLRKWPGYFLALFTEAKSFRGNPIIGSRLLNRLGLHVIRMLLGHATLRLRWFMLAFLVDAQDRRAFYRQGYIVKENLLTDTQFNALKQAHARYVTEHKPMHQGDTTTRLRLISPDELASVPALRDLIRNPTWLGLQRFTSGLFLLPWLYFLRIENGVRGGDKGEDPQKAVHADTFHPAMKSWLFLEDITPEKGPFTYYPGSHRLTWRRIKWEYNRSIQAVNINDGYSEKGSLRAHAEDIAALGLKEPESFTVPANTLVIANTFGFHCRGQAKPGAARDAIWSSGWRAPFLPLPLPDTKWLRRLFHRLISNFLGN